MGYTYSRLFWSGTYGPGDKSQISFYFAEATTGG